MPGHCPGSLCFYDAERAERLGALEAAGLVDGAAVRNRPANERDRAIVQAEWRHRLGETPLFGGLSESLALRSTRGDSRRS